MKHSTLGRKEGKGLIKELFNITGIPILLASLCCLSPVILVLLGITSTSFASSLSDTLYGHYRWVFRLIGIVSLIFSLVWYIRKKKGICTLQEAKRQRNKILNIILLSFLVSIIGYIVWLYVVVEYIGKLIHIWS